MMNKFIRILGIVLLAISAIFAVLFYAGPETTSAAGDHPEYTQQILTWAAILAAIAAASTLIFQIVHMVLQPRKARGSLIGIVVIAILVLIGYGLASAEPLNFVKENPNNVPQTLKQVGTGLITMYILLGLGILSIIYTEVSKSFK
ncbi:MAG: hypothetical protein ACLFUW_10810 [Bacteroidales bacterium]